MPKSVNRVVLLGNVGKSPEAKKLPSGDTVASFSLATSERFKDKSGQWQDKPEWHAITVFGKLADVVNQYVRKGSKLYVEGRIQTRSWDKDGETRYRTEIVARDIVLLSGKDQEDRATFADIGRSASQRPTDTTHFPPSVKQAQADRANPEITDDDIPF